jgi:hypothetical protein
MAFRLDREELLRLARLGAEARLEALERERKAILANFPNIKEGTRTHPARAHDAPVARRRNRMSASQRKAVSARMKKYWAERKRQKNS